MDDIAVEPNTYYIEKNIDNDVVLDSRFGDTFFGLSATGSLNNGPNRTYYLAKTRIIDESDILYGSLDAISQMYVKAYVNNVSIVNQQTAPFFDIYKIKDNLSLTEGDLTNYSGTVGNPITYSSYYQFAKPWRVENFDGSGKYFMLGPTSPRAPATDIRMGALKIKYRDWSAFVTQEHETSKGNTYDAVKKLYSVIASNKYIQAGTDMVVDSFNMVAGTNIDTDPTLTLIRKDNGYYGVPQYPLGMNKGDIDQGVIYTMYEGTRDDWINAGAWSDAPSKIESGYAFNQWEENYIGKVTTDNTMFSYVSSTPDIRDIKDQTLEGAGDNARFLAYSFQNLEQSPISSDGYVMHMKSFWENYAGVTTGSGHYDIASPFGYQSSLSAVAEYQAHPQQSVACIAGIPRPNVNDVTKGGMDRLTFGPEIEIVMKIDKMPIATTMVSGTGLDRSFTVGLTRKTPEAGATYGKWRFENKSDTFITFLVRAGGTGGNQGVIDVIGVGEDDLVMAGSDYAQTCVSGSWGTITGSDSHTTVPFDTWLKMRLKLCMASGATAVNTQVLAYFDGVGEGDDGTYGQIKCVTNSKLSNSWPENLTFFQTNMRAINDTNNVNSGYAVDTIKDDDKEQSVFIDSVSFYGWNSETSNTTMCIENTPVSPIMIPSAPLVRGMKSNNSSISLTSGVSGANYFAEPNTFTSTYLSFGYEASGNVSGSYLFFNDFSTTDERVVNPIPFISGGYWYGQNNVSDGNYIYSGGAQGDWWGNLSIGSGAAKDIRLGYYPNSVDRFTQKGSFYIQAEFPHSPSDERWRRTGNPLHAARIIQIGNNGKTIVVDKPHIFDVPYDTQFVVELDDDNVAGLKNFGQGTGSVGYSDTHGTALKQSKPRDGDTIFLNQSIFKDSAESNEYDAHWQYSATASSQATQLLISPYKYWINLAIANVSGSSYGHWFENLDATGNTTVPLDGRTYSSVVPTSNSGSTLGSTWNEYLFNDGIYSNRHYIDFDNSEGSTIVDLTTDYGFGKPEDRNRNPNDLGYIRRDWMKSGVNYYDLSNYIATVKPKPNDNFNFIIKPSFPDYTDNRSEYSILFDTGDSSNNPSKVIYGIVDNVPEINDFQINPVQNFLDDNVRMNIKSENEASTDIVFTWNEKDKDIWYRMIWIDKHYIRDKYHQACLHIPLSGNTTTAKYNADADNIPWVLLKPNHFPYSLTGTNTPKINGFQGYGSYFNGSTTLSSSAARPLSTTSEMTFVCHLIPEYNSSGEDMVPVCISGNSGEALRIAFDTTTTAIKASLKNKAVTVSSSTAYPMLGQEPLAVVVTYNKNLDGNNLKLYVNGKLEDTADYTANLTTSGNIYLGNSAAGDEPYKGFMEEITSHVKCGYVAPNAKSRRLSTKHLPDLLSGSSNNYNSRMFVFDYTNIRGYNKQQVGASNATSWKITGVN